MGVPQFLIFQLLHFHFMISDLDFKFSPQFCYLNQFYLIYLAIIDKNPYSVWLKYFKFEASKLFYSKITYLFQTMYS